MKKNFLKLTLFAISTTVILYSCMKDTQQPKQSQSSINEFSVSSKENRLVFNTIEDYEKVVNQPTEKSKENFLQVVKSFANFESFAEKQNASPALRTNDNDLKNLINDDYFKSILNADLAVQIGAYIYRVNPSTEKVYALPVVNANQYNDLITENTANTNIRIFSTGDDVLDLIKNKNDVQRGPFCKENPMDGRTRYTSGVEWRGVNVVSGVSIPNELKFMKAKADFNRYGIYYSLIAEAEVHVSGTDKFTSDQVGIYLEPVFYHVRCGTTVGPLTTYGASGGGGHYKYNSYQGSKNLNKLYIRIKATAEGQETDWAEIRVNY